MNGARLLCASFLLVACADGGNVIPRDLPDAAVDAGSRCPGGCPAGSECIAGACLASPPDADADGFRSNIDCDDGDATVGRTAERACAGPCGGGLERCTDGAWGACDAPVDCECVGSETRQIACTMCGVQSQQCAGGTWESVGACTRQGVCAPGSVETGEDCGRCGVQRRTCTEGCSFSDWTCVEAPERCDYWVFASGGAAWTGYRLPSGPFAPAGPVRGAAPIDGTADAMVVTDTTYHMLRRTCVPRSSECWVASGPRAALFPELGTARVLYMNDIPAAYRGDGRQGIDFVTADQDVRYLRDVATGAITHDATNAAGPFPGTAPPVRASVRAAWTDLGNADGWVDVACGSPAAVPSGYIGLVERATVHVFAPGCDYFLSRPYATFGAFAAPGAPPIDRVGAAFHRSGLFVLAETR